MLAPPMGTLWTPFSPASKGRVVGDRSLMPAPSWPQHGVTASLPWDTPDLRGKAMGSTSHGLQRLPKTEPGVGFFKWLHTQFLSGRRMSTEQDYFS